MSSSNKIALLGIFALGSMYVFPVLQCRTDRILTSFSGIVASITCLAIFVQALDSMLCSVRYSLFLLTESSSILYTNRWGL